MCPYLIIIIIYHEVILIYCFIQQIFIRLLTTMDTTDINQAEPLPSRALQASMEGHRPKCTSYDHKIPRKNHRKSFQSFE